MGKSLGGAFHMYGNVDEWVSTEKGFQIVGVAFYYSAPLDEEYFNAIARGGLSLSEASGDITIGFRCAYHS